MMVNFVFFVYIVCIRPSESKVNRYLNLLIESIYLIIEGLFYGYCRLDKKNMDSQFGFGVTLIVVEAILFLVVFGWVIYKAI
jgi:hypothetical protein